MSSEHAGDTALGASLTPGDVSRIIEMAWEDRTPFEAIAVQFGLGEPQVILLMREHLKRSSFVMWRKRVAGRTTKHGARSAVAHLPCDAAGHGGEDALGEPHDPPERSVHADARDRDVSSARRG